MIDIKKTARLFIERNGIVEVRVIAKDANDLEKRVIASGYYDNVDALIKAVNPVDKSDRVKGVYVTLNQPKAVHTSNLNQPISRATKQLSDRHIGRYTLLLIDLDPERETDTNSITEELEAARLRCVAVVDALTEEGFPEPARFMSGNGYHALYAIDLPVEEKTLIRDFLKALHHKFSDGAVKVDTAVKNPARITKLYGTMTRKGPDTPERPQRRSYIKSIPDNIVEVTREQLQGIVSLWSAPKELPFPDLASLPASSQSTTHATRTLIDAPAYCQKAGLEIIGTKGDAGSTIYKLKECVFNSEHKNNDASIIQGVDGVVRYQCFHDSCQGRTFQDACKVLGVYPEEWGDRESTKASNGLNSDGSWPEISLFDDPVDGEEMLAYPFEALPEAIYTAAEEVSRFCKVSPVAPAIVGISVIAAAIGKKAMVEERLGLYHYPALFFIGVAGPSERKTPTFKAMTEPLNNWAKDRDDDYQAELSKVKFKNSLIDAALSKKQSEAKKENADLDKLAKEMQGIEGERVPYPASPRIYTTDATEQKLFQLMDDHGGAYAVLSGEGRTVINAILGRYSDGTGEALYLAGISGDCITRDRVGSQHGPEEKAIYDPCLNVCIMVQPDKDRELATNPVMKDSGLDARIWRAQLPIKAGSRMEKKAESGLNCFAMGHYAQLVAKILDAPSREKPHIAKLSPEAAEARRLFHNEIERQLGSDGILCDVADIAGKCCSQTTKAALVFHLAETPSLLSLDVSDISIETWSKVETIGRFHLQESVRLRRSAVENSEIEKARKVARWLAGKGFKRFSKGELMRTGPRPRLKKNEAQDVIETLIENGVILKTDKKYEYAVNPQLPSSVATIAKIASTTSDIEKLKNDNVVATPAILATNGDETPTKESETLKVANSEFELF